MSAPDHGGPALPVQDLSKWQEHGMTLRDYFAAAALAGVLAHPETHATPDVLAGAAFAMADAMLKAREA